MKENFEENSNEELNPTKKEVNDFFENIAKQFGENIKFYDADNYSEEEIIEKYKNQGWEFIGKSKGWSPKNQKDGKIYHLVGLGEGPIFLVFEKDNN
jgi:hypothetical protein